jgi:ABC-type uncharacterized transport system substrate-binding protein
VAGILAAAILGTVATTALAAAAGVAATVGVVVLVSHRSLDRYRVALRDKLNATLGKHLG